MTWFPAMAAATPVMERLRSDLLAAGVDLTEEVEKALAEYTVEIATVTREFVEAMP